MTELITAAILKRMKREYFQKTRLKYGKAIKNWIICLKLVFIKVNFFSPSALSSNNRDMIEDSHIERNRETKSKVCN